MSRFEDMILPPDTRANQPFASDVVIGALYFVTDEGKIERSNGLDWEQYGPTSGTGDIRADGSVPFTADQSMGGNTLTNVADPTNAQDAATKAYVDASGTQTVVQITTTATGAAATGTTTIPFDDTIPQNTEGTEFMSLSITPTNSAHKLRIDVSVFVTVTATPWIIAALFQDSTANALATAAFFPNLSTAGGMLALSFIMDAGTTSATTFKVRIGPSSAATVTFNGQSGGRIFGGSASSRLTITEYIP